MKEKEQFPIKHEKKINLKIPINFDKDKECVLQTIEFLA